MKIISRFKMLSFFLIAAYILAACGGTLPEAAASTQGPKVEGNVVAFTGIVEEILGSEWTVSGQKITLDPQVSLDPNIAVGDTVKVEANVLSDGAVVALKVESSGNDDVSAVSSADASSTPEPIGTPSSDASSTAEVSTSAAPQAQPANEAEIFGAVEALTANTITINGLTYSLTSFTEFKDAIGVGDEVKLHVISNADGSLTVRELEKSFASMNDNSNASGSDDGPNHDLNDDANDDSDDDGDDHGGSGSNSGSGDDE